MKYAFITWNSQINERFLDQEFLTIFKPLLFKQKQSLLSCEKQGTPQQHYHAIFSMPDSADIVNLLSKFNTLPFKKLKQSLVERKLQTKWEIALKPIMVKKDPSDHNYLKTLGYVAKEHIIDSRGYDEEFVSLAVQYYWNDTRKDSQGEDEKKAIFVLNGKNCHTYTHHFCEKHSISLKDEKLTSKLARKGISLDNVSTKQMVRVLALLNLREQEENKNHLTEFEESCYEHDLDVDITADRLTKEEYQHFVQKNYDKKHLLYSSETKNMKDLDSAKARIHVLEMENIDLQKKLWLMEKQ